VLKKLSNQPIRQSFGYLFLSEFLLAYCTAQISKCISQRMPDSDRRLCLGEGELFYIYQKVTILRVQDPISDQFDDLDFIMLFQKLNKIYRLLVETFVSVHNFDKRQRVLTTLAHFELAFPIPLFQESLEVIDFVGLAVLFVGEIKKPVY